MNRQTLLSFSQRLCGALLIDKVWCFIEEKVGLLQHFVDSVCASSPLNQQLDLGTLFPSLPLCFPRSFNSPSFFSLFHYFNFFLSVLPPHPTHTISLVSSCLFYFSSPFMILLFFIPHPFKFNSLSLSSHLSPSLFFSVGSLNQLPHAYLYHMKGFAYLTSQPTHTVSVSVFVSV